MDRNVRFVPLLLLLAVAAAYGNALYGVFQFDDYNVIVDYGKVHGWAAWYADSGHGLRSLLKLTYTANWLSDAGIAGFHLFNICLHFCTVLLIYFIVPHLFGQQCGAVNGKREVALFAALLFAVHPANTEAITYISGRSMSLMTLFYLAALLSYIKGVEEKNARLLHVASPALFALAVVSKETAVTLPFALMLWEICRAPACSPRSILRRQAVHWCVFSVLVLLLLFNDRYWHLMAFSAGLNSLQENFMTQLHAMTYLLGQLLLPWRVNIDPDLHVITAWSAAWQDGVLWLALSAVAIMNLRRRPWLCFALGWFMLQLFPLYVFLPRLDIANDRQLYLAGWPMLLPVAVMMCNGMLADTRVRYAAMALVAVLAGLTVIRNEAYRSEVALWEDTARYSPHKARVHNNLGYAYFLAGDLALAEQSYLTAIRLSPDDSLARNNLARLRDIDRGN